MDRFKHITVRVPERQLKELERLCQREDRSRSSAVRLAIDLLCRERLPRETSPSNPHQE